MDAPGVAARHRQHGLAGRDARQVALRDVGDDAPIVRQRHRQHGPADRGVVADAGLEPHHAAGAGCRQPRPFQIVGGAIHRGLRDVDLRARDLHLPPRHQRHHLGSAQLGLRHRLVAAHVVQALLRGELVARQRGGARDDGLRVDQPGLPRGDVGLGLRDGLLRQRLLLLREVKCGAGRGERDGEGARW